MKIGFIGFGHMAEAMYRGLIKAECIEPRDVTACAFNYEKLLERAPGIHVVRTAEEVAKESGVVFICVKPSQVKEVVQPIKKALQGNIVISVAFGLDFDAYEEIFNSGEGAASEIKHISIIPNTPCEVCRGITIVEEKHNLSDPEYEVVRSLLKKFGEIEILPSDKMWLAGEMTSCGPAFAAMFIEALGNAGAKYGIDPDVAYRIVARMVSGTGSLQVETGKNPGDMVTEVATPGGVTIKGVTAMKEAGFDAVVARAIDAIEEG